DRVLFPPLKGSSFLVSLASAEPYFLRRARTTGFPGRITVLGIALFHSAGPSARLWNPHTACTVSNKGLCFWDFGEGAPIELSSRPPTAKGGLEEKIRDLCMRVFNPSDIDFERNFCRVAGRDERTLATNAK